jgi:hypothetical protein
MKSARQDQGHAAEYIGQQAKVDMRKVARSTIGRNVARNCKPAQDTEEAALRNK